MGAFHPFAGSADTFGHGTNRGENFQTRTEYAFRPTVKAYIHYETHRPDDFYASNCAPSYFVQAQVTYQFTLFRSPAGHK
jgi:hypothetical protein